MLEATFGTRERSNVLVGMAPPPPPIRLCPEKRLFSACAQPHWHQALPQETGAWLKNIPYCWPSLGPKLVVIAPLFQSTNPRVFCHVYFLKVWVLSTACLPLFSVSVKYLGTTSNYSDWVHFRYMLTSTRPLLLIYHSFYPFFLNLPATFS